VHDKWGISAYGFSEDKYWRDDSAFPPLEWMPNKLDKLKIKLNLDIEGFLYNWKKKEHWAIILDDIVLNGKKYHAVKLITHDNDTLHYYINSENYLITKISLNGDLRDGEEHITITFREYKKVQNIMIPFKRVNRIKQLDGGYGNRDMIVKKVEINPKFDKPIFDLNTRIKNSKNN